MATQGTILPAMEKQWKRDLAKLNQTRAAYWEFILTVADILESKSYHGGGYATADDFLEDEIGWKRAYGYRLVAAAKARDNVSTIVDNPPSAVTQLAELAKIDNPKDQQQVFAKATEKAESEGRQVTANDIKREVKAVQPPPAKVAPKPPEPVVEDEPCDWIDCPLCDAQGQIPMDFAEQIPPELDTEAFRAKWAEWLAWRKREKKKTATKSAQKKTLADLAAVGEPAAREAIDRGIRSDHQGIFPNGKPKESAFERFKAKRAK